MLFMPLQYIVLVFFSSIGSAIHFIHRFQRIMESVQYKLTAINIPCKLLKFPGTLFLKRVPFYISVPLFRQPWSKLFFIYYKGTPFQIDSEKECLEVFWNRDVRQTLCCQRLRSTVIWLLKTHDSPFVIFTESIQFRACRDPVIYHQQVQAFVAIFLMHCRNQHAFGIDAHHLSGRKIYDRNRGLSNQLFGS